MKKRILGLFLGIVLLGSGLPHTARAVEAELPADGGTGQSISQEGLERSCCGSRSSCSKRRSMPS